MPSPKLNEVYTLRLETTYIDPQCADVIIDMIAQFKEKISVAEEQLELLVSTNKEKRNVFQNE